MSFESTKACGTVVGGVKDRGSNINSNKLICTRKLLHEKIIPYTNARTL